MKRTQLYIDESLFHKLALISQKRKTTISDLVRQALEKVYGSQNSPDSVKSLYKSFGMWTDHKEISSVNQYVRGLRKSSRLKS